MTSGNTYKILLQRAFLTEGLPEPLQAHNSHLQIFDNYIEATRLRLRKIRVPETKQWTRVLEQRFPAGADDLSQIKYAQMFLSETEYKVLEHFKGRELRKNRYFTEAGGRQIELDVFLGPLRGLSIAKVYFETAEELEKFELPEFAVTEVTQDEFFFGENLVGKTFEDVRAKLNFKR